MTTLLAVLEFRDYVIIAGIVVTFAGGAAYIKRRDISLLRLERQMRELHQKLDALLKHEGVEMPAPPPSGLSREVELLARDPSHKIAAIKLYREENRGVSLAEAKLKIEEFYKSSL